MKKLLLFSTFKLLVILGGANVLGQGVGLVKGKIKDAITGEPLIGASVHIEGTSLGAATDLDGNYEIGGLKKGNYTFVVSYISYNPKTFSNIEIKAGTPTILDVELESADVGLDEVQIVARANRESEGVLLLEQKAAVVATQAVGARELARKGAGDAEAAVTKVSGISKQQGVKNVFIRGLGDRYNSTTLNNFPIPSEDPEYKNIALEFFGTDIIQSIGVDKVFSAGNWGDVGGANINIMSKELIGDYALGIDISGGFNTQTLGEDFYKQDGVNFFGISNRNRPSKNIEKYKFSNSWDLTSSHMPVNMSVGAAGGKKFSVGENENPLSFFVIGSYATKSNYTDEKVRNTNSSGTIDKSLQGKKYSQTINQLVLGNINYGIRQKHEIAYNFMMVHNNSQYVGNYKGLDGDRYQDGVDSQGYLRRQQSNDNILITNQLITDWELNKRISLHLGGAFNYVKGLEPDRRVFNLSKRKGEDKYMLTGSTGRNQRYFSTLDENDLIAKAALVYKLKDKIGDEVSKIEVGYNGRYVVDEFEAIEYDHSRVIKVVDLGTLKMSELYNQQNLNSGQFSLDRNIDKYDVEKVINAAYVEATYQLSEKWTANAGLRMDDVLLEVKYNVNRGNTRGKAKIDTTFFLPSINLKYAINEKNALRLGVSKTYTLPQSKEISPYPYVSINFKSQGNVDLRPSNNYNLDLKWDYYMSPSELFSITGFYKHIIDPIARVEEGGSGGYLTYRNIADFATVAGAEMEFKKRLLYKETSAEGVNKLSLGVNLSYIYTDLEVDVENTPIKKSKLEGAAPFIGNLDLSYSYNKEEFNMVAALVMNYFSDRVYTIGTLAYEDVVEKGVPTLDFVSSLNFNKHFALKFKATNLLNPSYQLSRDGYKGGANVILNEYKKGISLSLGISYDF